ncbi:glycosyltransferase family 2 protein [Sphingomonas tabacisoli]|uniref:Glycosyltransferase family 2 protein n=1 Tax=Sphingomonas tabacisoli TaxID=2249466 RepID=A0ABW4I540_9SPHN
MTKVSFVIPTLNRGRYVVRAVASCLAAARKANVTADVVVLDSQSDDGSWEALNQAYSAHPEVLLAQNARGLGPTRSWLDGADLVSGDFVTFIWSDDYVAPDILVRLLPSLSDGADLALGRGVIRDVDDESPFPISGKCRQVDPEEMLKGYFGTSPVVLNPPASPACALFSRSAFDSWRQKMPELCHSDELAEQLMWRRAIGPDMLLFMIALGRQNGPFAWIEDALVQFSAHADSITISSPSWLLKAGYWAARCEALLEQTVSGRVLSQERRAMTARTILQGMALLKGIPRQQKGIEASAVRRDVRRRLAQLFQQEGGTLAILPDLIRAGVLELRKLAP